MYKLTDTFVLILLIFAVFYLSLIQHYIKCLQFFLCIIKDIVESICNVNKFGRVSSARIQY